MTTRVKVLFQAITGIALCSLLAVLSSCNSTERSIPKSERFVLSGQATELLHEKALQDGTVLQSFAFDNVNQHIYFVQVMSGGNQLPGETKPVSNADRALNGDLTLTKLDFSGNKLGHMSLKGFGHGVQIGVEAVGNTAYLWTETDSVATFGTQIARFKFENDKTLSTSSPELEKHRLIENVEHTTVNIDSANGLLTMRYRKNGVFRFGVYALEEVKRKQYTPISDVPQPSMGTFQGFASYGNTLYLLEGNAYGSNGSVKPNGNTYITAVDLKTGEVVDKQLISVGETLVYREPEGLGIRIPDVNQPDKAELGIGFASSLSPYRLANIYAFNRFVPVEAPEK
ncbi:phage baseplate protein [Paenibacillus sp. FSL H8-0034]|uniref:phage baseplate protein n=1 Tax=Paenibacillus sp. FSL H8-0034 TaxID=2954671 RepID=UPI0030FADAE9